MQGPVQDFRSRLKWARDHIDVLEAEINRVRKQGGPYVAVAEKQADGQSYVYRAHQTVPIPPEISFLTADIVANIRATLDNLAFQLVKGYGPAGLIGFPICRDRQDFDAFAGRHFSKLPPEAIREFERVQPYHTDRPRWHPIRHMNRLWITDKHRTQITAGALPGPPYSYFEVLGGDPDTVIYPRGPVHEDVVVAEARVKPGEKADFKAHISFSIGFDERGPVLARLLPSSLLVMHGLVSKVVTQVEPFFR